ncbi:hypothetical protein [Chelatococcus reniformis]|uniref:Uncharacterized protein n=1 Tax=Chelatococcus reniformis TaxID=1494448 RepID=A0A916UWH3_9HYPH|nr:hypothetical protein [Chelatococcus reniformis]GGC90143.1 hypothetical protein GCM10010994_54980 [Chelatococcus reniformis]
MPNVLAQLEQIELDILACEEQMARQHEVIDELRASGDSSDFAAMILQDLEDIQAKQISLRDKLRAEVARRALAGHGKASGLDREFSRHS